MRDMPNMPKKTRVVGFDPHRPTANSAARRKDMMDPYYSMVSSLFQLDSDELEACFLDASRDGNFSTIEQLLQHRDSLIFNIDARDGQTGNTALMWAAKRGHAQIVERLVFHGADITPRNYGGQSAVEVASPTMRRLLLDSADKGVGHRNLLQAAWQGNAKVVKKILDESCVDIDCRNSDGLTPLLLVTRDIQFFDKFSEMLTGGYDPTQVISELLDHDANPNAADSEGKTPLHYVASSKASLSSHLIGQLLHHGSDVGARDRRSFMPIHCASQYGNIPVVVALLDGESDVNARGFAGATPLHVCAINGHDGVAMTLLKHGADVTIVDENGLTPVEVAKTKKIKSTLKQAWAEATEYKSHPKGSEVKSVPRSEAKPVAPPRRKKAKGEVIFDSLPPTSVSGQHLQRFSANGAHQADTFRAQEGFIHDMANPTRCPGPMPYSRTSRSPVRSGVRLSPLKASRDRKDLKFRPGTKMHDGTSTRVGSASVIPTTSRVSADPVLLPSSGGHEGVVQTVTIVDLDTGGDHHDGRWKRMISKPLLLKGHVRHFSDTSAPSPSFSDFSEDFYLRGRNSRASILSLSDDWEDPQGISSSPPNRLTPLHPPPTPLHPPSDPPRRNINIPSTISEVKLPISPTTSASYGKVTAGQLAGLKDLTPIYTNRKPLSVCTSISQLQEVTDIKTDRLHESPVTNIEERKDLTQLTTSHTNLPDGDAIETQVRTSGDSGLPDEKCQSSKSNSMTSSSSNLSTGSPTQSLAPIEMRVTLGHILETSDNDEKDDVREQQLDESFRRHSDDSYSVSPQTDRHSDGSYSVSPQTDRQRVKSDASDQMTNGHNNSYQLKTSSEHLMSTHHVQSTRECISDKESRLNNGANSGAQHCGNVKNCSTDVTAAKSTDCDSVRTKAAVGLNKANTGATPDTTMGRTASVERKMQSHPSVPVTSQGFVAVTVKPQPSLIKTKQVPSRTPLPSRNRPKVKQITRPQPSGLKPQVTAKTRVQRVTSAQQSTRVKAQQRLTEAVRITSRRDAPMIPPRLKKQHSISSMSPAIQQLQRSTPQKRFVSPTREQPSVSRAAPEQLSERGVADMTPSVSRLNGAMRKSSSMKEFNSLVAEQKLLSNSAGAGMLAGKLLSDGTKLSPKPHYETGQKHIRTVNHGGEHTALDADMEKTVFVKSLVQKQPAATVVTQYINVEPLDGVPDNLNYLMNSTSVVAEHPSVVADHPSVVVEHPSVIVEHTGPVIQDAFESLNEKKAEEVRTLQERQRQQQLKPKSAVKSRPVSSVKKLGAKSGMSESRPLSVKKCAKTKGASDDTPTKSRKGRGGKKGKSKKKSATKRDKCDQLSDNFVGDTDWCSHCHHDVRGDTLVQPCVSSSGDDSDDEYLFSRVSRHGSVSDHDVIGQCRKDVDETLPGQPHLVNPVGGIGHFTDHGDLDEVQDLCDDAEAVLDEVAFGVDDGDVLELMRSNKSSQSFRLEALVLPPQPEYPLRHTAQAIEDFERAVNTTEFDRLLETPRVETSTVSRNETVFDDMPRVSTPPEKPEDEDMNKIIEEILKSTPDSSKSLSLKFKECKRRQGSGRRSTTMEDLAKEWQRSQERTFCQLPTQLSGAGDTSTESTLTESQPQDHSDPDKSSSSGELDAEQMKRLMNTVKRLQLRVEDDVVSGASKQDQSSRRPPRGPHGARSLSANHLVTCRQNGGARKPEKSPRFVRRHESFVEVKGSPGSRRQSVSKEVEEAFTNESFSSTSVPEMGADELVPQDRGEVVTSRLGHRSAGSRASSAATSASTVRSSEGEVIHWKRGNMLGKGAYGTVWCGLTNLGELIAVKQIQLNIDDMERAEIEYGKIQEEVELLKTLNHQNIVGYLGTSLDDDAVSIFMQYVAGGSIANLLARFGALDEQVFRHYTAQILCGVEHLHASNVIHRDIKGGNVMIMQNGVVKLIDFGCAKRLCINIGYDCSHKPMLKSMKGTPYWMAPEVVMETGHGTKSDIWSIGCTVFEMATKKPPWGHMAPMAAIFAIGTPNAAIPQLPGKFSSDARNFVNCCLIRDQSLRWPASELLQHPFIARHKKKSF